MPLHDSKADGNITFLPGRSRYSLVNITPTWCYHKMATGKTLNGKPPKHVGKTYEKTDPTIVAASVARYEDLEEGGLFSIQANSKCPLIVHAVENDAGASISLVLLADTNYTRAVPTTPFKLGSGEAFVATGGSAGSSIGIFYEIDSLQRW